ncbi:MAG: 2-dehydro-3-deoxygalactonokinase [Alphaproteobacteria bacterium]|nr:2-dehydro-3-deoxygalactonokinase [Alphaproteobacteria bacterium]
MIAVDWGTSSLRAHRLGPDGKVLEKREAPLGILQIQGGDFAAALESQAGDWEAAGETTILMSGMIGSRQGWSEASYVECPAGAADLARRLHPVAWRGKTLRIVPGLVDRSGGVPDVMRGEETQLVGALPALGPGRHTICLPGTHSKWVRVEDGRIAGFRTHMTGEVFAVLKQHSILGRLMSEGPDDDAAFGAGVDRAREAGGLLHHLFGARTRGLFDELPAASLSSYLSGLLIGHELAAEDARAATVHVLGAPHLARRYLQALERLGRSAAALDPDAAAAGLFRIASSPS